MHSRENPVQSKINTFYFLKRKIRGYCGPEVLGKVSLEHKCLRSMRMGMSARQSRTAALSLLPTEWPVAESKEETMVKAMVEGDLRENIGISMGGGNTGNPGC